MGSISDYLENSLLDHLLKNTVYTPPANIYFALSTADPTEDGSGIAEPSGNGYARAKCNTWNAATSRQTKNTNQVSFATPTGSWGTITHFGIFDALTGGNFLGYGALSVPRAVATGDDMKLPAESIAIVFSAGGCSNYLAQKLLDHVFITTLYSQPANIYVALCTAVVLDSDTGSTITEPSNGAYTRRNHNSWDAAVSSASENTGEIAFAQPTNDWGTITDVALVDALSAGNVLIFTVLGEATVVSDGDTVRFLDGAIDITLS